MQARARVRALFTIITLSTPILVRTAILPAKMMVSREYQCRESIVRFHRKTIVIGNARARSGTEIHVLRFSAKLPPITAGITPAAAAFVLITSTGTILYGGRNIAVVTFTGLVARRCVVYRMSAAAPRRFPFYERPKCGISARVASTHVFIPGRRGGEAGAFASGDDNDDDDGGTRVRLSPRAIKC